VISVVSAAAYGRYIQDWKNHMLFKKISLLGFKALRFFRSLKFLMFLCFKVGCNANDAREYSTEWAIKTDPPNYAG